MNKEVFIVLIAVTGTNAEPRKTCEHIENHHYPIDNDSKENPIVQLINDLEEKFDFKYVKNEVAIYAVTDFMDMINDQIIDGELDKYFMSYVYITF